jgi:hypothetical protein
MDMELGFSGRSSPLSFFTSERIKKFVSRDEDLNRAGWKMVFPAKSRFDAAYHCRACKILIVDYGRAISSKEAKAHAASVA